MKKRISSSSLLNPVFSTQVFSSERLFIITFTDGSEYEGYWSMGIPQGMNGKMTYANGDTYFGGWNEGKHNGFGTLAYQNGNNYEGDWKDGIRTGKGKFKTAQGKVYEGEFKNNEITGAGRMTFQTEKF
ncbi:MAG TPA: hypothetical protein PKC47_00420 [Petrimonas sp.]|nr:hypothetical protein [Petrimonas sp.]